MNGLTPDTVPPESSWSRKSRLVFAILVVVLLVALPLVLVSVFWEDLPAWLSYVVFGAAVLYCSFLIESDSVGIFRRPR